MGQVNFDREGAGKAERESLLGRNGQEGGGGGGLGGLDKGWAAQNKGFLLEFPLWLSGLRTSLISMRM